ncbi:YchF family ATPase [Desulfosarcina sp. OttesenSCG-928-A07]|nr:YchF family ATPase [Desulfosarcina sp. OttesenSCG-928-G17]MDL2329433.1 YchF family ATPase [Desulfosarcina sp. OttesenSCG-928-A07]
MRLGIIGLSQCGKATVFEALSRTVAGEGNRRESRIGTVTVPDVRIDRLSEMYQPRKTIYAQVEYFLPGKADPQGTQKEPGNWIQVRDCDALIHVIRNFKGYGLDAPTPEKDIAAIDQELIISDLVVVEKRLERLALDERRGKKPLPEEITLLNRCKEALDQEIPLRRLPDIVAAKLLRGFAFLSAKPMLILFNNDDEDDHPPMLSSASADESCEDETGLVIRAKLEKELAQMSAEEAEEFLSEFNITTPATDRVIQQSYAMMGLISFFTVGEDEVRAWTIPLATDAVDAAEVIHSDIKKGFIRAEVLAYADLMDAGTYAEARKKGTVRLEGKTYKVADGDIINFRFNV